MTPLDPPLNYLGHFACGVGLHLRADCCGKVFETASATCNLSIYIPRLPFPLEEAFLVAPEAMVPVRDQELADKREPDLQWGVATNWTRLANGRQFPNAVKVLRLGFRADSAIRDTSAISTMNRTFPAELDTWWELFCTWVGVLTGEDPRDYLRVIGATRHEPIWAWVDGATNRRGQTISEEAQRQFRDTEPLDATTVAACMKLAAKQELPPAEWSFIRDARSAILLGDYRRAVIDAGTAAELAITELLDQHLAVVEPTIRDALLERAKALDQRSKLMKDLKAGIEPKGFTKDLKTPRNIAAHRGEAPSKETAEKAVRVAIELVEQSTPLLSLVPEDL